MKFLNDLKAKFTPKTAAERERLKRLTVYTMLSLSFLSGLWIIYAPRDDEGAAKGKANMELPEQTSEGMPDTKLAAYQQAAMKQAEVQNDSALSAVASQLDSVVAPSTQTVPDEIQNSAEAYRQAQASLQEFYVPDYSQTELVGQLQSRIDELEAQHMMTQQQSQHPNEMELMEQSYKLAAQYLGTGAGQQAVIVDEPEKERKVMPVNQVSRNVVSSLSASGSNTRAFSTAVGTRRSNFRNTISACIASDQSITDGQSVRLRTLEPMRIGSSLLPKNTILVGAARLQGERLEIRIDSVEALGCIMEVDLSVYDSDGQEGINIPNSIESDALHEIGANMGSSICSSINLTTNAGAQLASDVGKGLINGVSQYLNKKLRTVKVHLKSGYKIMLKQNEQ